VAHAAPGARVLSSDETLGLDAERYEQVPATGVPGKDALLARRTDWAVLGRPPGPGFERLLEARPQSPFLGPPLAVYRAEPSQRLRFQPIALQAGWLSASENAEALGLSLDGRRDTGWSTLVPQRPGQWVEVRLPEPLAVARVDLDLGNRPLRRGADVDVWLLPPGSEDWKQVPVVNARASDLSRIPPANLYGQELLVVEPFPARAVRLTQGAHGERRWGFAEIRLFSLLE
jgi:hypothetical protein